MEKRYEIYDKVGRKWIPVSEEFHKNYCNQINVFRIRETRRGHCNCPRAKFWLCDCDCHTCDFYKGNGCNSLDSPIDDDGLNVVDTIVSDQKSTEATIEDKELLDALRSELKNLNSEDFKLCQLLTMYSQTEVAKKLGITRSAFRYRWGKLQEHLAKKLEKFF